MFSAVSICSQDIKPNTKHKLWSWIDHPNEFWKAANRSVCPKYDGKHLENKFYMFTLQGWPHDWNWRRAKHSSPSGCKKRLSWDHRSLRRTGRRTEVQHQDQTLEDDSRVWRGTRRHRWSFQTTTGVYLGGKIFKAIKRINFLHARPDLKHCQQIWCNCFLLIFSPSLQY